MLIAVLVRFRLSKRPKLTDATKLRIVDREIWLDDFRMPRGEIFWTREQADFIFERLGSNGGDSTLLSDYLSQSFQRSPKALNAAVGFDDTQIIQRSLVEDGPHAIVIGSTGSGKTELLRHLLREFLLSDANLELVCIDFKGGAGLDEFKDRSLYFASDHDLAETQELIVWLENELARRELAQGTHRSLVIAVDELSHLLGSVKKCAEVLNAIAARGRSAQMHLVMTNQNLAGVSRSLLSNVKLRVLVGNPDPVDAAMLGQLARATRDFEDYPGFASAQIVAHGSVAQPFRFALPGASAAHLEEPSAKPTIEPRLAQPRSARVPRQRRRSAERRHEYLSQGRGRHRLHRQLSIRGLLSHAHRAESH